MTVLYTFLSTLSAIHMVVYLIIILDHRIPSASCHKDVKRDSHKNSSRLVSGLSVHMFRERNEVGLNRWCTVSIRTNSYIHQWGDNHFCGGAIMTSRWVLTAAHCVTVAGVSSKLKFRLTETSSITVVVGTMNRLQKPDERNILQLSSIWVHSKYERTCDHDIALLKLNRPIWSSRTYPKRMQLPMKPLNEGSTCYTMGWGRFYKDGPYADELMVMPVSMVPYNTCMRSSDGSLECPYNLCLTSVDERGSLCHGDTGSPLYCDGVLYGLAVVIGKRCSEGGHMVYINLYNHVNWIHFVMANCCVCSVQIEAASFAAVVFIFLLLLFN